MTTQKRIILSLAGAVLLPQTFFAAETLHPFTHQASIPATAQPATIAFQKVKATKVFTTVSSTMDPDYCKDLQFRDPGGSLYCPQIQYQSPAPAYEVTYSYKDQPMASDEYGNGNFTFQVYFRPEGTATRAAADSLHTQSEPRRASHLLPGNHLSLSYSDRCNRPGKLHLLPR